MQSSIQQNSIQAMTSGVVAFCQSRPKLTAFAMGAIAALGFPPLHLGSVSLAAVAVFVWLVYQAPSWSAALGRGWWFGWAHLTLANNWIATAFTHQAKMPEFLGWLAVPLLGLYLALYPSLAALLAHLAHRKLQPASAGIGTFGLLLAASWIVMEWLRSWAFTGYPWPPLGLVLLGDWSSPGFAILLPWLGTYALSGFAIILVSLFLLPVLSGRWIASGAVVALIAIAMIGSKALLPAPSDSATPYALVQPNLGQDEINDASKFEQQFARIADLTLPGRDEGRLVLWPESAIPDYLEDGYPQRYYDRMTAAGDPEFARRRIGSLIGDQSTLLTGVVNLDIGEREYGLGAVSARNSVIALNSAGEITESYAKAHLVPYGEYLPMRTILEPLGLSRLVAGTIDYLPGPGPRTLDLGEFGKAGIQICYEIVFSGQVTDRANRPDYLFNPSNDGWFGRWGPPQHLAQARLRALEEGLPVLRSTTTGISAVIDANGVVRQSIATGEAARIDGMVPAAHPPTLFSRFGNAVPMAWAALLLLIALGLPRLVASREADG